MIAVVPPSTGETPLANSRDVVTLLADTINRLRTGNLDPRIANAVGYLANILLGALQQEALEDRLLRLESSLGMESGEKRN